MNEKLNITLPAGMVEIIKNHVDAGLYASSSDVLEASMKLFLTDDGSTKRRWRPFRRASKPRWMILDQISLARTWTNGSKVSL